MIESILEHQPFSFGVSTSAITVAAGATAATATNYGNLAAGNLISYLDDAGVQRWGQIAALPGDPNVTLETPAQAATTAKIISISGVPSSYYFESNNANLKSDIVTIGPGAAVLSAPSNQDLFNANEGFEIKSVYLRLPYQFTLADGRYVIEFKYYDAAGAFIANIHSVGELGELYIPRENSEIEVNAYVPPAPGGVNYKVHAILRQGVLNIGESVQNDAGLFSISNIDAPASLNGAILQVKAGIRIVHAAEALT